MIGKDQEMRFKSPGLVKQISLRQARIKLSQVVLVRKEFFSHSTDNRNKSENFPFYLYQHLNKVRIQCSKMRIESCKLYQCDQLFIGSGFAYLFS